MNDSGACITSQPLFACQEMIWFRFKAPTISSTGMTDMPVEISYEIICALERMPHRTSRIVRVRRVAREHDAIHAHRNDEPKGVENADVQIRDDHLLIANL